MLLSRTTIRHGFFISGNQDKEILDKLNIQLASI